MTDLQNQFTQLIQQLPKSVPFVAPEALERQTGVSVRLRLGANESSFGPSPKALAAMEAHLADQAWYGDPENYDLRQALADRHQVPFESIAVGCGIDDLLGLVVRLFVEPGDVIVTSAGAYPTFNYHVTGHGGRLHFVPYTADFKNDLPALAQAAREVKAKLVYLANPDNPTGSYYEGSEVAAFLAQLPESCLVILDEAYIEFAPSDSALPLSLDDPRVIRMRTFSKAYGMAGARIGYLIAAPDVVAAMDKVRLHFGVARLAQVGALAALGDGEFLSYVIAETDRGRREYAELAARLGYRALPSRTNFVAIDVGSEAMARQLVDRLFAQGVFIRMPGVAPLSRCIRVTVGTPAQRDEFARVFPEVVEEILQRGGV
ncbi:MAG: histidinol-phosphate transaminase [Alicyclobacillus herbarius]|uniref:histidinol-phosphate transaminase n=1 Tax=Alicyclobacillus herbarius TaxID=122960 RepID=UPI0023561223|nr:histidinol-phosphate transaminase [Alicyclobacillus herbarius]MCL6632779.1 histidinol-phosphate transaminase [Alicyclobacillus herbarius]